MGKTIAEGVTYQGGGTIPTGTIVAWMGGSFTAANNAGNYTLVMAGTNDVSGANTYLTYYGYKVCDGTVISDGDSPLDGLYVPNLTDEKFLKGDTTIGSGTAASAFSGDNNSLAHTHNFTQPDGHDNHTVGQYSNHSFTQLSAHGITQPTYTIPGHKHQVGNETATALILRNSGGSSYTIVQDSTQNIVSGSGLTVLNVSSSIRNLYSYNASTTSSQSTSWALSNNHSGGGVNAHTGLAIDAHSGHSGGAVTSVAESLTDLNKPTYLSCFYIIKIK